MPDMENAKKITIMVTGVHRRAGEEAETVTSRNFGIWEEAGGTIVLTGEQEMDESGETAATIFRITDTRVKMVRKGRYASVMVFEKGIEHHSDYQTPYGVMDMTVRTEHLEVIRNTEGRAEISADIAYALEMSGQETSRAHIRIECKEAE